MFAWGYRPAVDVLFLREQPTRPGLSNLCTMLLPVPVRKSRLKPPAPVVPWLTAEAVADARRRIAKDSASEPVSYARRLAWYLGSRHAQMLLWTTSLLAEETSTLVVRPFLDALFLAAWGRQTGHLGFRGRTAAMNELFGDLLPAAIIERADKGMYWHYWGQASRQMARTWQGGGVDGRYVDPQALGEAWASTQYPTPDHRSALAVTDGLVGRLPNNFSRRSRRRGPRGDARQLRVKRPNIADGRTRRPVRRQGTRLLQVGWGRAQ